MPIEARPGKEKRKNNRFLSNVVRVPDFSLTIPADPDIEGSEEYEIESGSYPDIIDYLAALGLPPAGVKAVELDDLRLGVMPFVDMAGGLIPVATPNPDLWASRVATIIEHYRRTFQIPYQWVDNSLSIRAVRWTTIDVELGTRAPSPVWVDYSYVRNSPALLDIGAGDDSEITYAVNVFGYPRTGAVLPGVDADFEIRAIDGESKCLARAELIEEDLGIIRIEFLRTPGMHFAQALPGTIIGSRNATVDLRNININVRAASIFFNGAISGQPLPKLNGDWKMATILTLVPASPNDESQLFAIEVNAQNTELNDALPDHIQAGQALARGPVLDVRIPPSVETARGVWRDTHSDIISQLFGVRADNQRIDPDDHRKLEDLIVNLRTRPVQAGRGVHVFNELEAIAIAEAARVYTEFSDRIEGNKAADAEEQIMTISGNMDSIEMVISPNGEATVNMSMPTESPKISMFAFLDAGTRRLIMRLAR